MLPNNNNNLGSDKKPAGYWKEAENRETFFHALAEKMGFDPSDAQAWRKVTTTHIQKMKVRSFILTLPTMPNWNLQGRAALLSHFSSPQDAIENTFPELQGKISVGKLCITSNGKCSQSPNQPHTINRHIWNTAFQ